MLRGRTFQLSSRFCSLFVEKNLLGGYYSTKATPDVYFTKDEVAKHDTEDDCWLIVHNKVYDVTEYVGEHPGGDVILHGAGKDATDDFEGNEHSDAARELLSEFCIGKLKE